MCGLDAGTPCLPRQQLHPGSLPPHRHVSCQSNPQQQHRIAQAPPWGAVLARLQSRAERLLCFKRQARVRDKTIPFYMFETKMSFYWICMISISLLQAHAVCTHIQDTYIACSPQPHTPLQNISREWFKYALKLNGKTNILFYWFMWDI